MNQDNHKYRHHNNSHSSCDTNKDSNRTGTFGVLHNREDDKMAGDEDNREDVVNALDSLPPRAESTPTKNRMIKLQQTFSFSLLILTFYNGREGLSRTFLENFKLFDVFGGLLDLNLKDSILMLHRTIGNTLNLKGKSYFFQITRNKLLIEEKETL